ncbi:nitrate reductase molybdenum cofactor assembly chaperone [Acidithiobacillus sp. M4-SHS-6]|uniref:nitrate reductase molybdenum cofactor assembly chaperone n=1 Tax=Acidithiobacillus sp. M4-SHS-6 TaxID=3383024 RepID=UPI0039BDC1E6
MFRQPILHFLALLLDYPDVDLRQMLPEMMSSLDAVADLQEDEKSLLRKQIQWMQAQTPLQLEALYVETFDWNPRCDLHLSNHLLPEDDRERGTVLVGLLDHYSAYGWLPEDRVLPDYLPVVLDFAAILEVDEARVFLGSAAEGISILHENLLEICSPYACLLDPVLSRGRFSSSMKEGEKA